MAFRRSLLRMVGLTGLLLLGAFLSPSVHAQDRGAPHFGPTAPGDTLATEAVETGRLWSLATLPVDRLERRYDITADSGWATHLRRGVLRLPDCGAALVSANGLALTSADCVQKHLETGTDEVPVVAEQPSDERSLTGFHADRLVEAMPVTPQVERAAEDTSADQAVAQVQEKLQAEAPANRRVEVVAESGGDAYAAYTYRRYTDVRLAFLPDASVSDFGGTDAAMSYPRQVLDVALLRIYTAEGTPLSPDHFFEPSGQGVRPGDAILAGGPSRATRRAESADQLAARRDLILPARHAVLDAWVRATQAHLDTVGGTRAQRRAGLLTGEKIRKRTAARLDALQDDAIITHLQRRDDRLRERLRQSARLRDRYGGVLDSLASLQESKRRLASAHRAFGTFGVPAYGSRVYHRIVIALDVDSTEGEGQSPHAPDTTARPATVETALLAERLERVEEHLQSDSAAVRRLLNGRSPEQRAASIVESSALAKAEYEPAGEQIVPSDDPAASVVDVLRARARSFSEKWSRLQRSERRMTERLARARLEVDSTSVQQGGGEALRLTDGRALGYPYNGTTAPPFTTFYGLYGQSRSFEEAPAWALPERWHRASTDIDRSVPLNLAVSTDPALHPEGAPLLNKSLEIVGVSAGVNVQGGAGTYLFLPRRMRTVGVDLRGLRESLQAVYGAEALVSELFDEPPNRPE